MVVGGKLAQRAEVLRHEHEHAERREERKRPFSQTEAEHDGDGGKRERREQVEHRARERSDAQRLHRHLAEALGSGEDPLAVPVRKAERAQDVDSAQRVDEMVRHAHELAVPARRIVLGRVADHAHI